VFQAVGGRAAALHHAALGVHDVGVGHQDALHHVAGLQDFVPQALCPRPLFPPVVRPFGQPLGRQVAQQLGDQGGLARVALPRLLLQARLFVDSHVDLVGPLPLRQLLVRLDQMQLDVATAAVRRRAEADLQGESGRPFLKMQQRLHARRQLLLPVIQDFVTQRDLLS